MTTGQIRPRRTPRPVVAVTGAASGAGRLLAARLARRAAPARAQVPAQASSEAPATPTAPGTRTAPTAPGTHAASGASTAPAVPGGSTAPAVPGGSTAPAVPGTPTAVPGASAAPEASTAGGPTAGGGAAYGAVVPIGVRGELRKVVALDAHRGDTIGVTWRVVDIRDPLLSNRLSDVDVLVHLDLAADPEQDPRERRHHNLRGAQTVVTAAAAARVRHVVLVTSAMVYGAAPDNPVPLPEDAALRAEPNAGIAGDFLEIEELAAAAPVTHPGLTVTVVRPATLVGPGVDTVLTRHFEAPRLLAARGCPPRWQFCHIEDLAAALEQVVLGNVGDARVLGVGAEGWLGPDEIEEITGRRRLDLPAKLTLGTVRRLHRLGLTPAPDTDLSYAVYPWVVDCAALRAAGWKPTYDNAAALRAMLAESAGRHAVVGRRLGAKEATVAGATAAGATVAALGTAAIVHHTRKRRKS